MRWAVVPGWDKYEVSDDGQARRLKSGRLLKPDIDKRGRRRYTLCQDGRKGKFLAGRLVLIAFVGPCPEGKECCHENGDESDNRAENLRWGTRLSNTYDKRRHGTQPRGGRVWTSKLTEEQVIDIRRKRRLGAKLGELASEYKVTESNISMICRGGTWFHIPDQAETE